MVTFVPSSEKNAANSEPMTPAPTTSMDEGISRSSKAEVEVNIAGCEKSNMGSRAGSEPVAKMILSASTVWDSAPPSTRTTPADCRRPVPLMTVTPGLLEQDADVVAELGDDAVLALHDAGQIGPHLARDLEAVLLAGPRPADGLGAGQESLGGDAAPVQAGAADEVLLDEGDGGPLTGGAQRGHVSSGPAPQDGHAQRGVASTGAHGYSAPAIARISGMISSLPMAMMCTPSQTLLSRRKRM